MKILILGGTRFFGKLLVQNLIAEGHQVSVATTGKTPLDFSERVEHFNIERHSEESLVKAFAGHEWDLAYDQICYDANDAKILALALKDKIGHLIFTSSQSVYDDGLVMSEADFTAEVYEENPQNKNSYQEGKRLAEKEYTTQLNFAVTSVRFPIVLGANDPSGRLLWHVSRVKNNLPIYFPNINSQIGFISSEEAAQFLAWLKDKKLSGSINAGSPDSISLRELMELIQACVGSKSLLAEVDSVVSHSPFGLTSDWTMSMMKAEKLGYDFSPLKAWLPQLIAKLALD